MYFIQNSTIVIIIHVDMRGDDLRNMNKSSSLQVRHFDDSMWDHISLYENMPYVWDSDLNAMQIFTLVTGNIIKSYRCITKEPYEIKH